jgi:hypothetical protein
MSPLVIFLLGSFAGSLVSSSITALVVLWWLPQINDMLDRYDDMVCRLIEQRDRLVAERNAEGEGWKQA